MKKLLLVLMVAALLSGPAMSRVWTYDSDFAQGPNPHGVVVAPDGKIWIGYYAYSDTIETPTGPQPYRPLWVYNPDGTLDRKVQFLTWEGVTDTIWNSCRGLSLDNDGNILFTNWYILWRINYLTDEVMNRVIPPEAASLTEAACDTNGYIYITNVVQAERPIYIYDQDFELYGYAEEGGTSICRSIVVSSDGNDLYLGRIYGGTLNNGIIHYYSDYGPDGVYTPVDTLWKNILAQCLDWDNNGLLWVGSYWEIDADELSGWYALDPTQDFAIVDTVGHNVGAMPTVEVPAGGAYYAPRGAAWSAEGTTMYTADFDGMVIKKWTNPNPAQPGDPPIMFTVTWANLQWPPEVTIEPGTTDYIYGQVYEPGITGDAGTHEGIEAQLGYGADGSMPGEDWTWVTATFNTGHSGDNNDEYMATLTVANAGIYDYCYRYSLTNGPWLYADLDGTDNGYDPAQAGNLVVTGEGISLEIPVINAIPSDTCLIPLNVQFHIDSTFSSAEITIGGYIGLLDFIELVTDSSLIGAAGWTYQVNETDSLLYTAFAGAEDISGEGVLFWLKFAVPAMASGFIPITLESAIFNTGEVPTVLFSGGVNVIFGFIVNSTGDGGDSNPGDGICDDGTGHCTFRAAIEEANACADNAVIYFDIPGPGPHTIQPNFALPIITDPVIIDGTTEPDFEGTPIIELDGSNAGEVGGLTITSGNSSVRGLVINRFFDNGIDLWDNDNNVIEGNFIGTDVTGTVALGNGNAGVMVGSANNLIGGFSAEARNIISGNLEGVTIVDPGATGNLVQGNYIGTDVTGTVALGNAHGVLILATENTIGGMMEGAGNVISGNSGNGIVIGSLDIPEIAEQNLIQGNYIGTDVTGTAALGNENAGVYIENASNNTIGGTDSTAANTIAYNHGDGVFIVSGVSNAILSNSFFLNLGLGIDLSPNGVSPNDPGDADAGPNNRQNFPEISTVWIDANGDLWIDYYVDSDPSNSSYPLAIQFFKSDPGGEGKILLGDDSFTTTDFDNGFRILNLGNAEDLGISTGDPVVATATDSSGNTSEFSSIDIVTDVVKLGNNIPESYALHQNCPNPFNPVTTIEYAIPEKADVIITVYNLLGQEVVTLVNEHKLAGYHQINWDAAGHSSGIYFYQIQAGEFFKVRKMILLK